MKFNVRLDFFLFFFFLFSPVIYVNHIQGVGKWYNKQKCSLPPIYVTLSRKNLHYVNKDSMRQKDECCNAIHVLASQWSQINSHTFVQTSHTDAGEKPSFRESNLSPADHLAIPCEKHLKSDINGLSVRKCEIQLSGSTQDKTHETRENLQ